MDQRSTLLGLWRVVKSCCKCSWIFLPTRPETTTPSGGNSLLPSDPGAPLVPSSLILGMEVTKQTQTLFTVWIGGLNRGTWDREAILVWGECQSKTCIRICMNKDTNKILSYLNLLLTTYGLMALLVCFPWVGAEKLVKIKFVTITMVVQVSRRQTPM